MTTSSRAHAEAAQDYDYEELVSIGAEAAGQARTFLVALREVAFGQAPQAALPLTLLAVSQVQLAGAKLGAMVDVVPAEQFEPDDGPDPDLDAIREGLQTLFSGVDDYSEVADPVLAYEVVQGSLANDLASIAQDLAHGLRHWEAGSKTEALWWWQFSYLSNWGERCAAALRVLLTLLAHVRLDVDDETAMEAELAALHAEPQGD
ncbi:DUF5063 domain-containing protein [Ornithinimicrobium sp. Arc0846-15]|nr:DUF5063 domain-containing protein [Ornithinimicrobium laminariae]